MITYKWTIPAVEKQFILNGLADVITEVHWRYIGKDENGITGQVYGSQKLNEPNSELFTPYSEISEEDVIKWLESNIDVEDIKKSVISQIESITNPSKETSSPPWSI